MRYAVTALLIALLAGCGGGDAAKKPKGETDQLRGLAETYLHAVAGQDWKAVCATRSAAEVRQFAREAGSCERAFEVTLRGKAVALFENAHATDVRIRGNLAGIDVVQEGQSQPATTLAAVREGGGWKLKDVPDAQTP